MPTTIVLLLSILLIACSQSKTVSTEPEDDEPQAVTPKTRIIDTSKPASFEDYKLWRKENDPAGQSYADYKEWENAYQRWKLENTK